MLSKISFISLFLSTCAFGQVANTNLTEINVQLKWLHQFQFAGYYSAIEQGYYQAQGLKVNLLERQSGLNPIESLILGDVDYAIAGVGAVVYRVNKVPLVAVAAIYQQSPSIIISRYPQLSQLKNKKIMLSKGVMNAEITSMLTKANLSANDYTVRQKTLSIDEYSDGVIDAYNGYITNETYRLSKLKTPYYIFKPRDYGIDFYGDILYTTERFVKNDKKQVEAFKAATVQGWQYAIEHVDETIKLIQSKYNSQNKAYDILAYEAQELIKLMHSDIVPIGYMSEKRWYDIANVLKQTNDIKSTHINLDGFIFNESKHLPLHKLITEQYPWICIVLFLLISTFLFFHNYRLKQLVRERTRALLNAKEVAEQEARTDSLTGLANRRRFMEVVAKSIAIAKRNELALSIIYIDIDWFKKINDTYGHSAGDNALSVIGEVLKRNIRSSDTPARIGGEEFAIVCFEKSKRSAEQLAERIRKDIESSNIKHQNQTFHLTASLGVACIEKNEDIDAILKKSDKALYQAKEQGRNRVTCA